MCTKGAKAKEAKSPGQVTATTWGLILARAGYCFGRRGRAAAAARTHSAFMWRLIAVPPVTLGYGESLPAPHLGLAKLNWLARAAALRFGIADSRRTDADCNEICRQVLATPPCCSSPGLGRRIRQHASSAAALLQWRSMLRAVAWSTNVSIAAVEREHASNRRRATLTSALWYFGAVGTANQYRRFETRQLFEET